jgi:hypothetical protein
MNQKSQRLRITVTVPNLCPRGTAVIFAITELLKDIPEIAMAPTGKRITAIAEMEQGGVRVNSVWLKE